jgi:hypothetical protein
MPLVPKVTDFPVYNMGKYGCDLEKVEADKRTPFGSPNTAEKIDCYKFTFLHVDDKHKPVLIDDKEVRFYITTGTAYGGKKAALTNVTNQMVGRPLDKETEAPRFDYEKLVKHGFDLLVNKEEDDGDFRNKITGIAPQTPVDVEACLIPINLPLALT